MIRPLQPQTGILRIYHFDGNLTDSAGAQNGSASNISYANSIFGQEIHFNGVNSEMLTPAFSSALVGNFFIAFWSKNESPVNNGPVLDDEVAYVTYPSIRIDWGIGGAPTRCRLIVYDVSSGAGHSAQVFTNTAASATRKWIVFTRDGTYIRAYVNGALENQTYWPYAQWACSNQAAIGYIQNYTISHLGMDLDELVIGNYAPSAQQIRKWYAWFTGRYC